MTRQPFSRVIRLCSAALLLSACGPGPQPPAPPAPPAPTYGLQFIGTLNDPQCQYGVPRTGLRYTLTPEQLQPTPTHEALLGVRCPVTDPVTSEVSVDLVHVYRLTPAGLLPALPEPLPAHMDSFMQTPGGLALHQAERTRAELEYVDPGGQRFTLPWQIDPDVRRGWAANTSGIDALDDTGMVYGWHFSYRVDDQGRIGDEVWHTWTWRPGDAQRRVLPMPITDGAARPMHLGIRPGAPGSGERILLAPNGILGHLQKPDGTVVTAQDLDPALRASTVNFERWTERGYFVRYTRQVNEADVEEGQRLYRDGRFIDPGMQIEAMAADGDMIVVRSTGRQLVRLNGQTHDLVLPPGFGATTLLPVGGGIVYAQQVNGREMRLYRLVPLTLQPTVNLTLSSVTPADTLTAEPLRPTHAGALLSDGGRLLRLTFEIPATTGTPVHTRTLTVTVRSTDGQPLTAGKTFQPAGTASDASTGVTYTNVTTSPMSVNLLSASGGTVSIDTLSGNQLKLSFRDVKLTGNKGQAVTLNGSLNHPEIVRP